MHPPTPSQLSTLELAVRMAIPILLAAGTALAFDRLCARRGLLPPGFAQPWRRTLANAVLAGVLWVGVFRPIGEIGLDVSFDPARITTPQLFALHALMVLGILV